MKNFNTVFRFALAAILFCLPTHGHADAASPLVSTIVAVPSMLASMGAADLATLGASCAAGECKDGPILKSIKDEKKAEESLGSDSKSDNTKE